MYNYATEMYPNDNLDLKSKLSCNNPTAQFHQLQFIFPGDHSTWHDLVERNVRLDPDQS